MVTELSDKNKIYNGFSKLFLQRRLKYLVKCRKYGWIINKNSTLKKELANMIAAVNWCGRFLKTKAIILQTFFTDTLEAQQFTAAKVTINQFLNSVYGIRFWDNAQKGQDERDISAVDFLLYGFVKSVLVNCHFGK